MSWLFKCQVFSCFCGEGLRYMVMFSCVGREMFWKCRDPLSPGLVIDCLLLDKSGQSQRLSVPQGWCPCPPPNPEASGCGCELPLLREYTEGSSHWPPFWVGVCDLRNYSASGKRCRNTYHSKSLQDWKDGKFWAGESSCQVNGEGLVDLTLHFVSFIRTHPSADVILYT